MKESLKSVTSFFNTYRMLKEYTQKLYMPASEQHRNFCSNDFKVVKDFTKWLNLLKENWNSIKIHVMFDYEKSQIINAEEEIEIQAEIYMPELAQIQLLQKLLWPHYKMGKLNSLKLMI
jgi:Glucan phosphorylase